MFPKLHFSDSYVSPESRKESVVVNLHLAENAFPALPGKANTTGGSASVHALQSLELGDRVVMTSPSARPIKDLEDVKLPAAAYEFFGQTEANRDDWFHKDIRDTLVHKIVGQMLGKGDIQYAHMHVSGVIGLEAAKIYGNPVVYLGHAWEQISSEYDKERGMKEARVLAEYKILHAARHDKIGHTIVTNTEWEIEQLATKYSKFPKAFQSQLIREIGEPLSPEEIRRLCIANPLGVSHERFNPELRAQLRTEKRAEFLHEHQLPTDTILIGSWGRICAQKDPKRSIEIFDKLRDLVDPSVKNKLRLVLAGPKSLAGNGEAVGYYREVLDWMTETKTIDLKGQVLFPGPVDAQHFSSVLDIGLDTSIYETWGLSNLERLACGLPSVSTKNPVYEELYANSRFIMSDSVDELATRIAALIEHPSDRENYAAECYKISLPYAWRNSVASLQKNILSKYSDGQVF